MMVVRNKWLVTSLMMHRLALLLFIFIALCSSSALCSEDDQSQLSARQQFRLPKIFDFHGYMQMFGKRYGSFVEMLARKKVYMARAFRAFVSAVAYKHAKADYYLGINKFSDKTREELRNYIGKRPTNRPKIRREDVVASEENLAQELVSIVEESERKPELRDLADELKLTKRKRSTDRRSLDIETDLYPKLVLKDGDKTINVLVTGMDSKEPSHLKPDTIEKINSDQGSGFLWSAKNLISSVVGGFLGDNRQEDREKDKIALVASKRIKPAKVDSPDQIFVDHREGNCLSEVKDQDDCGSCYIFSTLALYEWHYCQRRRQTISFSEQYVIDCGLEFTEMTGCEGGTEQEVADFIRDFGLELSSNYKYEARNGTCPYNADISPKQMGFLRMKKKIGLRILDDDELESTLQRTPILLAISMPDDILDYKGGVHSGDKIEEDSFHSMLLVGHGIQDGCEYWLFRNSYGASWGENGYFKLNKAVDVWNEDDVFGKVLDTEESIGLMGFNKKYIGPGEMLAKRRQES